MKKIIFFDIDGTLYDFSGHMPASTIEALRQARANGHKLLICSGRAKYQMYPELFKLFDGVIGATGAYIEEDNEVLLEHFMQRELLQRIVNASNLSGAKIAAMTRNHMILNEECKDYILNQLGNVSRNTEMIKRIMGEYEISDHLEEHTDIQKVLYYGSNWQIDDMIKELSDVCDITGSSLEQKALTDGEITIKGINKSYGMRKYLELHGLSRKDTIAFGDGPNDLDMIEYAGIGVAMGNARQKLKDVADYVTKDISDNGIQYAMEHFGLI